MCNSEGLLSPCDCTGTLGTVHKSCLEKWLSSSNTSYCELCHTEFTIERRPRPITEVTEINAFLGKIRKDSAFSILMDCTLPTVHFSSVAQGSGPSEREADPLL